jgi:hypothetical protein
MRRAVPKEIGMGMLFALDQRFTWESWGSHEFAIYDAETPDEPCYFAYSKEERDELLVLWNAWDEPRA